MVSDSLRLEPQNLHFHAASDDVELSLKAVLCQRDAGLGGRVEY
jgi:hypothetical protein